MKTCLFSISFSLLIPLFCKSQNPDTLATKNQSRQGCLFISDSFKSFSSAMDEIDNTSFTFYDTYYPKSGKIVEASFYACEKKDGHLILSLLIIKTAEKNYILRNVQKNMWWNLRKAKSTDNYFIKNIKDKYQNVLNETS